MATRKGTRIAAFKAAFPYTVPIFAGFWFLGLTYGIYMNTLGFSWVYPAMMAACIFGGSLEFITASMLVSPFAPLTALLVAIAVQARHLFYGIAMLDRYKDMGWKKFFLVFGLCDETFSILYTAEIPKDVDRGWFMLFVTVLNYCYWVSGSAIGGLVGSMISFDVEGLSFVMTALFVVIFLEQWMKEKRHWTALVGFGASIACLAVFGADDFMLPTLACMLVALALLRGPMESWSRKGNIGTSQAPKLDGSPLPAKADGASGAEPSVQPAIAPGPAEADEKRKQEGQR